MGFICGIIFQGYLPNTYSLTSWLRQQSAWCPPSKRPNCTRIQTCLCTGVINTYTSDCNFLSSPMILGGPSGVSLLYPIYPICRLSPKQNFGKCPWIFIFYTINEAHKQYSLLDTIFNYILYLQPLGKYLYFLSPQNPLHVGRRSRPTCSRFFWLFYRYCPGGPR